ncbi:MAG: hypothetical protein JNJ71_04055 [Rubrivivax sp.]|nr:hypothetical protein [Rubrivivax sp.]
MATHHSQRRRAAWAVLAPLLDEDSLIEILWLQHDSMRGESVSDIIAFIDAVAARHLLDAAQRKRLYSSFFDALRQPEATLPMDPWPLMLQTRPSAGGLAAAAPRVGLPQPGISRAPVAAAAPWSQPPAAPVSQPPAQPVAPPVAAAVPQPAPQPVLPPPPPPEPAPAPMAAPVAASEATAPTAAATPQQAVFGELVSAMLAGVRQFHPDAMAELLVDCRTRLERAAVSPGLRQAARDALVTPGAQAWHLQASVREFSALAHEFYIALCETLGPVDADHVLMQAVRHAERLPQARQAPPSQFL